MTPHQDSVQRILDILKQTFVGGPFVEFYDGDPELIPDFNLPALVVTEASDLTDIDTSAADEVVEQIVVKVIYNKKDDMTTELDPLNMTERKIREVIGRVDPNTGCYATNTVKGALRTLLTDENMVLDGPMTVALGILPRPNDMLTAEGHVTVTVKFSVQVQ